MPSTHNALVESQSPKRILLLAFEGGTGIGHLRRIARLAAALQRSFSCLIVTGHREITNWFVSPDCEYVRLPAWESLLPEKAAYWGRKPFLQLSVHEAVKLRKGILRGVVESYAPQLIIIDHLPLGMHEELAETIRDTPCLKYLVTRGILNRSGTLLDMVLGGAARDALHRCYDRIVVTADRNVIDFVEEYGLTAELASKTTHVGYVVDHIDADDIAAFRAKRGIANDVIWVVVSAGGGQLGENLIRRAITLSARYPNVAFEIVAGPRSGLPDSMIREQRSRTNLQVHTQTREMAMLNASADIVICSGGYNTLLEALQGHARILCVPSWKDPRDEQTQHARHLRAFAEIDIVSDLEALDDAFAAALARASAGHVEDRRGMLDRSGMDVVLELAVLDLYGRSDR